VQLVKIFVAAVGVGAGAVLVQVMVLLLAVVLKACVCERPEGGHKDVALLVESCCC